MLDAMREKVRAYIERLEEMLATCMEQPINASTIRSCDTLIDAIMSARRLLMSSAATGEI